MNRVYHKIFSFKNIQPSKISLAYFIKKPDTLSNPSIISNQLKKEIEIRMAHRVINLSNFPNYLREYKEIVDVKKMYVESFDKIDRFPKIKNIYDCNTFGNLLLDIKDRHRYIPMEISKAVQEYKKISNEPPEVLNKVLDQFYYSRIGIRTIIDYYNFLFSKDSINNYLHCDIRHVIESAAEDASMASLHYYKDLGLIPKIDIKLEGNPIISYRPNNLYFIAFEILKNSIRAMVEGNVKKNIEVEINQTTESIIFVFRDFGPSVNYDHVKSLFDYSFTSVSESEQHKKEILAGFGHGLPLSRLYAKYFGGNLIFVPYKDIKSEVILYLSKNHTKLIS
jgi:pyruvate dehydrogenase kinase 2/3/4